MQEKHAHAAEVLESAGAVIQRRRSDPALLAIQSQTDPSTKEIGSIGGAHHVGKRMTDVFTAFKRSIGIKTPTPVEEEPMLLTQDLSDAVSRWSGRTMARVAITGAVLTVFAFVGLWMSHTPEAVSAKTSPIQQEAILKTAAAAPADEREPQKRVVKQSNKRSKRMRARKGRRAQARRR